MFVFSKAIFLLCCFELWNHDGLQGKNTWIKVQFILSLVL